MVNTYLNAIQYAPSDAIQNHSPSTEQGRTTTPVIPTQRPSARCNDEVIRTASLKTGGTAHLSSSAEERVYSLKLRVPRLGCLSPPLMW